MYASHLNQHQQIHFCLCHKNKVISISLPYIDMFYLITVIFMGINVMNVLCAGYVIKRKIYSNTV